ncbi:uncharacterized protein LOC144679926 isoform X2 [Cetorhinus maximus]
MKSLQSVALIVGLVTLIIDAAASAVTEEDVVSAAVADYNKRLKSPNAFKLFQIVRKRVQNLSEVTTYEIRFRIKETTCSTGVAISEIDGCDFKNDGATIICSTRALVPKRSPTHLRIFSMNCKSAPPQPRFNPDEVTVLARLQRLNPNEPNHSTV